MKITVSNEATLEDAPKEIFEWCNKNLVVMNPEYITRVRLGKWVGNIPQKLKQYRLDGDNLVVPIGALKDIYAVCQLNDIPIKTVEDFADNGNVDYGASVSLYDYQELAVKGMYKKGYGILQSKAGSGKTQMGIALAVALGKKTLWLTHTHDLLKQSYDRAKQYISEDLLGTITAGKVEIAKGITFATVQTLSKQDLTKYKYAFDVIIVDECHRVSTKASVTQFSKVISNIAARHKFGLSATVHRADGLIKTTFLLLGDIAYTVPDEAIADKVLDVRVKRIDTGMRAIPRDAIDTDGTLIYTKFISALNYESRNQRIADVLIDNKEHYNLILSDRITHLETLWSMLPTELQEQSVFVHGKMTSKKAKAEREQAIEDMREGKKHYLFASFKLAKEGLDIPRLDRLYVTTPQKDYAVVTQYVGRIARTFEGKDEPICYDFVDNVGMCENLWRKRRTHYIKAGCIVEEKERGYNE